MPLLSAPPFDPCLMRVLDHQYSNYITWKRGKTLFFSSQFSQCNPTASLMLSFLMHCLCCLFYLLVILMLKSFTISIWCAYFVPTQSAVIIIFPPTGLFTFKAVFQSCGWFVSRGLFTTSFLLHWLPTDTRTAAPQSLFSSAPIWRRKSEWHIVTACEWTQKSTKKCLFLHIGYNKRSPDYWHRKAEKVTSH